MENTQKFLGADILPLIKQKVDEKQNTLVSGTTIKTVNNESILGSGNIALPTAKLYEAYGDNEDGALSQKFATTKMQAIENDVTTNATSITDLISRVATAEGDVESLLGYSEKTVQTDTKLATDNTSTVTLIKTTGALNSDDTTDTEIPLPVASATQAGVISPATYSQIQDASEKLQIILGSSTVIPSLPANPTDDQLTDAYKEATSATTVPNGARVTGPDGKTYIYDEANNKWELFSEGGGAISVSQFTNTTAGTIKGDDADGKVFAESDGTGSVKGWDTLKSDVANNASAISTINGTIDNLGDTYATAADLTTLQGTVSTNTTDIATLKTGKQDVLVGTGAGQNIKSINGVNILGSGDIEISEPEAMTAAEFEAAWNAAAPTA